MARILVACEESQIVTREFRLMGHEAYSCDLLPCSGKHPEWHLQQDVIPLLEDEWDAIIAFPPCTHLASSSARWFDAKREDGRQQQGIDFFMEFVNVDCNYVAIENPIGIMSTVWRKPDQIIQPWQFGHGEKKATCLWLKGLPNLVPSSIARSRRQLVLQVPRSSERGMLRSKTYRGIARAMARQWGDYIRKAKQFKFYLGIAETYWNKKLHVPYMISIRRIMKYRRATPMLGDWLLDSGGFTELAMHGKYLISEKQYLQSIRKTEPTKAFCQDWMCEPHILNKTGKTVMEHQELTLQSYLSLRESDERIAPVLQGWSMWEYLRHIEMYDKAGVPLNQLFGLGSICADSTTTAPFRIIVAIKEEVPEIKLHGFGIKITAFKYQEIVNGLRSADSMAWMHQALAEKDPRLKHNLNFALYWYYKVVVSVDQTRAGRISKRVAQERKHRLIQLGRYKSLRGVNS